MKKFITVLLGIVMLISLECASTVWIVRNVISKDNIKYMLDKSNALDEALDDMPDELDGIIDEDKFIDEAINIAVDEFYYKVDSSNKKPNLDKLEEMIDEAIDKYEKKTGEKIERPDTSELTEEIDKAFDEAFDEIEKNNLTFVLDIFFKNTLLFITIGIVVACLILIFVIRKDFNVVLFHTGLVSLLTGFYTGFITLALKLVSKAEEEAAVVFGNTFHISGIICLAFIIVGIASLVLSFVLKKQNNTNVTTTQNPTVG